MLSMENNFERRLGRAEDLAKIFGCNKGDIYRRTRAGEFDSFLVRIGVKGVRYDLRRFEDWLSRGGSQTAEASK
jgi:predicted DNA-binding transcriptional regulator AlpA